MDEKSNGGIILVIMCDWEEQRAYQLWEVAKFIFNFSRIGWGQHDSIILWIQFLCKEKCVLSSHFV